MKTPKLFIGSSSEGLEVAQQFQISLKRNVKVDARVWNQGVFAPGQYTMTALYEQAHASDFALLVASADDVTESRGDSAPSPRDNVLLELGLFMGALGVERTFILCPKDRVPKLPSDLSGITRLDPYEEPDDGNYQPSLTGAVVAAAQAIRRLGLRRGMSGASANMHGGPTGLIDHGTALEAEIERVRRNVAAQGWRDESSATTLRFKSPKGRRVSYPLPADPAEARNGLRRFAHTLRANGLRVNKRVRDPFPATP